MTERRKARFSFEKSGGLRRLISTFAVGANVGVGAGFFAEKSRSAPRSDAKTDVFQFHMVFDAVMAAFAAQTGLFDTIWIVKGSGREVAGKD